MICRKAIYWLSTDRGVRTVTPHVAFMILALVCIVIALPILLWADTPPQPKRRNVSRRRGTRR